MNLNSVLNSVLRGGLGSVLGGGARGGGGGLGGIAGAAAATAALNLLLRGRGSKLLRLGGMAALGVMAYKAWQEYQAKQAGGSAPRPFQPQPPAQQEPPAQAEAHSRALLVAMIAAAKADGHVNDAERAQIEQALAQSDDADTATWLEQEMKRPLDPAEVARAAGADGALASELYLASLLVVQADDGRIGFMERAYLDELARQLKLPDGLKASLEKQAGQPA